MPEYIVDVATTVTGMRLSDESELVVRAGIARFHLMRMPNTFILLSFIAEVAMT